MVKFNRRDKKLKDFDNILDEITQMQNECSDDEISVEDFEYEIYSESEDSFTEENSSNVDDCTDESCSYSDEDFKMVPGASFNIVGGHARPAQSNCNLIVEGSDDFPHENNEYEVQLAKEQLEKLAIVDRSEYKNNKNILNPIRKKKSVQKRCKNFDD